MSLFEFEQKQSDTGALAYLKGSWQELQAKYSPEVGFAGFVNRIEKSAIHKRYLELGTDGVLQIPPSGEPDLFNLLLEAREVTGSDDSTVLNSWVQVQHDTIMGIEQIAATPEPGDTVEKGVG